MTEPASQQSVGRATWFAARARNATNRGLLVAAIGGAFAVLTLLVLVLVPREVNRVVRAQVAALPAPRDTATINADIAQRRAEHERAEAALRSARRADSVIVAMLACSARADTLPAGTATSTSPAASAQVRDAARDAESADLQQRLNRARGAPLLDNYRELSQTALLRGDTRVRSIIDSMQQVDREREAFAALGGPDARYAALSARMTALGQRLIRIAEDRLSGTVTTAAAAPRDSTLDVFGVPVTPVIRRNPEALRQLAATAAALQQDVSRAEQRLVEAREWNTRLDERRAAIMARSDIRIPTQALLVAALVVGVVAGYAGAFILELRVPRIADTLEAERISGARVILHSGSAKEIRSLRSRRRADRALPPVLDPSGDAYHLLHLTLTGLGEVARRVRVIGDSPALSATVAANLAAAAAREARAVLLVDLDHRNRLVAPLLQVADRRGMAEVLSGDAEVIEVLRDFAVGRDVYMTVLYGGQRAPREVTAERRMVVHEDLERLASRYDLTVIVGDEAVPAGGALLPTGDVILCTRIGATPNSWLAHSAHQVRAGGQRVRAVLSRARSHSFAH